MDNKLQMIMDTWFTGVLSIMRVVEGLYEDKYECTVFKYDNDTQISLICDDYYDELDDDDRRNYVLYYLIKFFEEYCLIVPKKYANIDDFNDFLIQFFSKKYKINIVNILDVDTSDPGVRIPDI